MTPWFSWSRTHNCSTATTPSVLGQDQFLLDLHASAAIQQHNTEARQTQLKCLVCMLAVSVGPYHPCQVLQFFLGNTLSTVWRNHAHHTYMPLGLVVWGVHDKCKSVLSYWFMSSKGWWFNSLIQNPALLPTCTAGAFGPWMGNMGAPAVIRVQPLLIVLGSRSNCTMKKCNKSTQTKPSASSSLQLPPPFISSSCGSPTMHWAYGEQF